MKNKKCLRLLSGLLATLTLLAAGCGMPQTVTDGTSDAVTDNATDKTEGKDMSITELKVNNLTEPMGIDTVPTFRWINRMQGYGRSQSAYRIVVASSEEKAKKHEGDVWDSGKTEGKCNYDIPYGGEPLKSRTEYFFAVQVWDEKDGHAWSEVSKFETGVLDGGEWTAKWISGYKGITTEYDIKLLRSNWIWHRNGAALGSAASGDMYFRKVFTVDPAKTVKQALYLETADNSALSYMNGTQFSEVKSWQTGVLTDVTALVVSGENTVAVKATNSGVSAAGYVAKLEIHYTDGSKDTVVTDASWLCRKTAGGAWTAREYDDGAWAAPDQALAYGASPWQNKAALPNKLTVDKPASAPMLRKTFSASKEIKKARAYVCGLGLFEMFVNGEQPDDTVLNPAHTQYEDTVHYRVFDVTKLLKKGENAVAVELGNGFYHLELASWSWSTAPWFDDPKLLFELVVEYEDGSVEKIVSDESWRTYGDGPVTVNNMYLGEAYDARKTVKGWKEIGFNDSAWHSASLAKAPEGKLTFENTEPMRRLEEYTPSVRRVGNGKWLIASPHMITGWAKIKITAPEGTEIRISYGEKLDANGNFVYTAFSGNDLQRDKYIASGESGEYYEPKYSYKGYKYILVENHAAEIKSEDVECYLIANDIETVSEFDTGNSMVNKLHEIAVRTMLNNFQGKPTDTPVYEKNGWTGDYNVALDMIHFNFDIANFNAKYMQDLEDAQTAAGIVPLVAPVAASWTSGYKHNPSWNMAFIGGVYDAWKYGGDLSLANEHYDAMRKCALAYLRVLRANGYVWTDDMYGDWVVPDNVGAYSPEGSGIICTAYAYKGLVLLAELADALGKNEDAGEYRRETERIYSAFNKRYYDAEKGYYDTGWWNSKSNADKYRQTSNLIPLAFGLCPDEYRESVAASVAKDIQKRGYHLNTGCIGTKHVLPELSNAGYEDLAYRVLTQNTYPSWGFWLAKGTDSAWESWPERARSYNHYFLATYDDWFFTHLAGIRDITNGYETVTLKPEIYEKLGYVDCSVKTVRGILESSWRCEADGTVTWRIVVPAGTTATVYLPAECVSVNGNVLSEQAGVKVNADSLTVLSGEYIFLLK